jgi:error-prone DNA polymerase
MLALGMLSAIRRALDLVGTKRGRRFAMHHVPPKTRPPTTCSAAADSVGTFQVESRAQMSMLPRLQPRASTTW